MARDYTPYFPMRVPSNVIPRNLEEHIEAVFGLFRTFPDFSVSVSPVEDSDGLEVEIYDSTLMVTRFVLYPQPADFYKDLALPVEEVENLEELLDWFSDHYDDYFRGPEMLISISGRYINVKGSGIIRF